MTEGKETGICAQNAEHRKQIERMLADKFICQLIGINLLEVGVGHAKAELVIKPEHMNGVGICQGGVLFSLADYALAAASNYNEDSVLSLDVSISYCRPVTSGRSVAEAKETCRTRTTALGDAIIRDEQGRVICMARSRGFVKQAR